MGLLLHLLPEDGQLRSYDRLYSPGALLLVLVGIFGVWWFMRKTRRNEIQKLPPGPFQWPFVGCLPSVGFKHRHRTFYKLSRRYGPIMHVPIGTANIIVVHGPELAMEVLKTQDAQFCSRPLSMTGKYLGFDHKDLNLSPYNTNWKMVRKAFSTELLSPSRLSLQAPMRREEVIRMTQCVLETIKKGEVVHVTKVGDDVVTRIILRMLFGNRYAHDSQSATAWAIQDFEDDLREGIFLWGELNLADFFPALARFDVQGLEARFKRLMEKLEKLFKVIIEEHKQQLKGVGEEDKDVIDILLSENQLSEDQIMGILSNTLIAGIHTTATAIEWGMAEMVVNPEAMRRAQEELDTVVGTQRLMNESDIPNLPYLQAACKEVFRLHPSAPLDDPHLNEQPATLAGMHHIPANSIILINLWALGQDASLWINPLHFNPDRFLHSDINVFGNCFHLLPFSSGRRRCPAFHMATLKLQHVLGVLLHAFDWAPPPGLSASDIDLQEGDGIVVGLKNPLMLSAKSRLSASVYGI